MAVVMTVLKEKHPCGCNQVGPISVFLSEEHSCLWPVYLLGRRRTYLATSWNLKTLVIVPPGLLSAGAVGNATLTGSWCDIDNPRDTAWYRLAHPNHSFVFRLGLHSSSPLRGVIPRLRPRLRARALQAPRWKTLSRCLISTQQIWALATWNESVSSVNLLENHRASPHEPETTPNTTQTSRLELYHE